MMMKRICVSGDFLRLNYFSGRPSAVGNIKWLYNLLNAPLQASFDCPVFCESGDVGALSAQDAGIFDYIGLRKDIFGWAMLSQINFASDEMLFARIAERFFGYDLVVGFELPTYVSGVLDRLGISWVDFTIHPVRFLGDLRLAMRMSEGLNDRVAEMNLFMPTYEIRCNAGLIKAQVSRIPQAGGEQAIFFAQTRGDRVQIDRGKFVSAENYLEQAVEELAQFERVLVKRHPLDPKNPSVDSILAAVPHAIETQENSYILLGNPRTRKIVTVSSGVGVEARFFDVPATFLFGAPMRLHETAAAKPSLDAYWTIKYEIFNVSFWRRMFGGQPNRVEVDDIDIGRPNLYRTSLRSFWGYNQIDTDVAVALFHGNQIPVSKEVSGTRKNG